MDDTKQKSTEEAKPAEAPKKDPPRPSKALLKSLRPMGERYGANLGRALAVSAAKKKPAAKKAAKAKQ